MFSSGASYEIHAVGDTLLFIVRKTYGRLFAFLVNQCTVYKYRIYSPKDTIAFVDVFLKLLQHIKWKQICLEWNIHVHMGLFCFKKASESSYVSFYWHSHAGEGGIRLGGRGPFAPWVVYVGLVDLNKDQQSSCFLLIGELLLWLSRWQVQRDHCFLALSAGRVQAFLRLWLYSKEKKNVRH